jgi:RNA binding exosome subunit
MLSTQIKKNKSIEVFVLKLQPHHATLLEELDARMDESNVIHLRLDLESVIGQQIQLAQSDSTNPVIKIRIKLAVYPGQDVQEIARNIFGQPKLT